MADAAAFAEWLHGEGRAANTVAAYRRDVAAYLRWCEGAGAGASNPLADYVEHVRATRQASSAARAVVALRVFHRWGAALYGVAEPRPELAALPRQPAAPAEPAMAEEAVEALLAAAAGETAERRRDAVAISLLYFAGLKAGEAISLDVADLGRDAAVLTADRDGPHERLLPVVAALRAALDRWLDPRGRDRLRPLTTAVLVNRRGQRLTRQGLWLITAAVGKRAKLATPVAPNDLRRACGAHLASREIPDAAVAAFLGRSRGQVPSVGILNQAGWGSCNLAS